MQREDKVGPHVLKLRISQNGGRTGPVLLGRLKQECYATSAWTLLTQIVRDGRQNCHMTIMTAEMGLSCHQGSMLELRFFLNGKCIQFGPKHDCRTCLTSVKDSKHAVTAESRNDPVGTRRLKTGPHGFSGLCLLPRQFWLGVKMAPPCHQAIQIILGQKHLVSLLMARGERLSMHIIW